MDLKKNVKQIYMLLLMTILGKFIDAGECDLDSYMFECGIDSDCSQAYPKCLEIFNQGGDAWTSNSACKTMNKFCNDNLEGKARLCGTEVAFSVDPNTDACHTCKRGGIIFCIPVLNTCSTEENRWWVSPIRERSTCSGTVD